MLNKTNARTLIKVYGADADACIGCQVCLTVQMVVQRLEAELDVIPDEVAVGQIAGVSGVKNGVNLDAVSCNQATVNVGKSSRLRLERWPSGRRRTPAKRVYTPKIPDS